MFNLHHPFFRPLWVRLLVTLACFAWTAVEVAIGSAAFAAAFAAAGGWCAYQFFVTWPSGDGNDDGPDAG